MLSSCVLSTAALAFLFASAVVAWSPNFEHAGAWLGGGGFESTPVYFKSRQYLMMSEGGSFFPDGLSHSFFCVFDGATGEKIVCPESSSGHAFCSAIVDNTPGRNETLWVFCSAWDRFNDNCTTPGWGCGACANPAGGCYVGSWSTVDATLQNWTFSQALTLPGRYTVPNVGVALVNASGPPPAGLPAHSAFMALEMDFDVGQGNAIAVNVGKHGDLSTDWIFLDPTTYGVQNVANGGLCPFSRYNPSDGYYYVAGGGDEIHLARSKNLTYGSWENPPAGPAIEIGCAVDGAEPCGPGTDVARIAPGFFTQYWANGSDHGDRDFLQNLTDWNWSVNDADVCWNGTHTLFLYGQCAQTAPKNFTGKVGFFYQVGIKEGSELDWLASYY